MADFLRDEDVHIVHAHDRYTNFLCIAAARLAGIPSIASKRWMSDEDRRHVWTNRIAFRLASCVLANSETVAESARRIEFAPPEHLCVIPNFIDEGVGELSDADRRGLRAHFGYTDEQVVVTMVARLRTVKNHALALRAFARVAQRHPQVRLLLVGDGPETDAIQAQADALGVPELVFVAGHMDEAWRCHAAGDISVLSSRHEGFPNTLVEAMACGRPVVATRVGGVPDAVLHERTGLLFDREDEEGFATGIERLVSDLALRSTLGARGRERAESFRAAVVIPQIEGLYRRLVAGARGTARWAA